MTKSAPTPQPTPAPPKAREKSRVRLAFLPREAIEMGLTEKDSYGWIFFGGARERRLECVIQQVGREKVESGWDRQSWDSRLIRLDVERVS